jgi:hypothetical protein
MQSQPANVAKKKPYSPPQLIVHGNVAKITLGSGLGFQDTVIFAQGQGGCGTIGGIPGCTGS